MTQDRKRVVVVDDDSFFAQMVARLFGTGPVSVSDILLIDSATAADLFPGG